MRFSISGYTATSAAGVGLSELRQALAGRRSGLRENDLENCDLGTWIGRVEQINSTELPSEVAHLDGRNNRLAWLALQQDGLLDALVRCVEKFGTHRIGTIMGTSTSSIGRTEEAYRRLDESGRMPPEYRQPEVHNLHSPSILVAQLAGLSGPSMTISTACSSSAKVFSAAARWLQCGLVDAVLVGGADSLCLSTLYGFNSLELVSSEPCRPFDVNRRGINIGEAAGYAIITRFEAGSEATLALIGYGESSDAYHMSHPHPDGLGALAAVDAALARAGLAADEVEYINLHGTASRANDLVETRVLASRFGAETRASSTKGWTGHTLGAAGILEAVITLDAMQTGLIPGTLNCLTVDPDFEFPVQLENRHGRVKYAMSNSFGFGGNNAALVFEALRD
ncbi:MAG: beta-ketoacyl-ACP synthase [Lysobacterales bacterium]|nr:MAG: beta-ketoacyl-ACP synthase [Xanthomonadales bacterium]